MRLLRRREAKGCRWTDASERRILPQASAKTFGGTNRLERDQAQ